MKLDQDFWKQVLAQLVGGIVLFFAIKIFLKR